MHEPRSIRNLELHVTHACNLACESCSHYSNQGHKGDLDLELADEWLGEWARRLQPNVFSLLGGEPTIHPRFAEFIPLVRRHFPRTHLRIVTNGFFLHRHPSLPEVLRADPDVAIYLSLHHESREYLQKVWEGLRLLERWRDELGIRHDATLSARNWTRRYSGTGASMRPFGDGNPRSSWEICPARTCPQIHEGKLWKCAPLAYLPMQHRKFGLSDEWAPYLAYSPLAADCSDAALDEFLAREEEPSCGMCPATPRPFTIPLPLRKAERA
jgi:hypothetical protein